jgi:broad specificity phosphatase PhoE
VTATILLIRHAAHEDLGDSLSGRAPDRPLSSIGRDQAKQLARGLAGHDLKSVQSSPVLRARQTADAIAAGLPVETVAALDEIDFGDWTGRSFAVLADDPRWHEWNSHRATASAPGGESMAAAQARAVAHVDTSAAAYPGETLAMVSHCDILRGVVAHYLGLSLDNLLRFDIAPASVTTLHVGDWGGRVLRLNEVLQ